MASKTEKVSTVTAIITAIIAIVSAIISFYSAQKANQISETMSQNQVLEKQPIIRGYVTNDTLRINVGPNHRGVYDIEVIATISILNVETLESINLAYSEDSKKVFCQVAVVDGVYNCYAQSANNAKALIEGKFFKDVVAGKKKAYVNYDVKISYFDLFKDKQVQYISVIYNVYSSPISEESYMETTNRKMLEFSQFRWFLDSLSQVENQKNK